MAGSASLKKLLGTNPLEGLLGSLPTRFEGSDSSLETTSKCIQKRVLFRFVLFWLHPKFFFT